MTVIAVIAWMLVAAVILMLAGTVGDIVVEAWDKYRGRIKD